MFIGLNPSTADENADDATVRRGIRFAKDWGYIGMFMCNLYAFVSTDPSKLLISGEKLGINNNVLNCIAHGRGADVVFSWGCFKQHRKRMDEVINMFPNAFCIEKSKEGYPKHPLYLNADLKPIKFKDY